MPSELEAALLADIRRAGLPLPVAEHYFAKPRRWRFDLAYLDPKIAVEVEGGTFVQGRHVRGSGFEKDCEKYAEALLRGWRVLRVTGGMIDRGAAINYLRRLLEGER